jgi:hypothetical protein
LADTERLVFHGLGSTFSRAPKDLSLSFLRHPVISASAERIRRVMSAEARAAWIGQLFHHLGIDRHTKVGRPCELVACAYLSPLFPSIAWLVASGRDRVHKIRANLIPSCHRAFTRSVKGRYHECSSERCVCACGIEMISPRGQIFRRGHAMYLVLSDL